jgi:hypothetical protein
MRRRIFIVYGRTWTLLFDLSTYLFNNWNNSSLEEKNRTEVFFDVLDEWHVGMWQLTSIRNELSCHILSDMAYSACLMTHVKCGNEFIWLVLTFVFYNVFYYSSSQTKYCLIYWLKWNVSKEDINPLYLFIQLCYLIIKSDFQKRIYFLYHLLKWF